MIIEGEIEISIPKANRIEIIDDTGRAYTNWKEDNQIGISIQDDGKTIKVFISNPVK